MSFFIRKRGGGRSLSRPNTKTKPGNTDMKRRPKSKVQGTDRKSNFRKRRSDTRKGTKKQGQEVIGTKKPRFDPDEEIESSTDDDEGIEQSTQVYDDAELEETAQQKKVRLAKLYLEEIEKEERKRLEDDEVDVDLLISKRLQEDYLESEGRLRREIADNVSYDESGVFSLTSSRHLKKSVTCLCISPDNEWIYSGCKEGNLYKWSVKNKCKFAIVRRKEKLSKRKNKRGVLPKNEADEGINRNSCHSSSITSIAISSDGKFLATGDLDKQVVIWDPDTLNRIHIFNGHRGAIRGLVFRSNTHTLYSSSDDRSIRIWSLDEMGYVETLFGHQDSVTSIDALSRERAISSGGRDNTIRIWKIVEESQLIYNGHYNGSVDVVKLVNEENFVSGGDDGLLCAWNVNKKKALVTVQNPHGTVKSGNQEHQYENSRWISALGAWNNTDLIGSGSNDGFLRLWKCGERFKSLTEIVKITCNGWINSIQFSHGNGLNNKFIAVGIGKEHKSGRWSDNVQTAKNSIIIIPLCHKKVINGDGNGGSMNSPGEVDGDLTTNEEVEVDADTS